ncbi:MAG: excinuclease ABC, partial [Enterococcus gallinarum]|nr:excinuclease ABC [Enterococcus gallinarum]
VNNLIALPEFRFEIPIETSLEAYLAADSSQVKVYQLSFGQIIHSEVVSTSDAFVPAPLTTAKRLLPTDLDPLHIILRQLRQLNFVLSNT